MTALERRIGYAFSDTRLLSEALTHPSAVSEGRSHGPDNQRLEFLGDAVLQLAVAHLLMESHPRADEGRLTVLRAEVVSKEGLAELAEALDLPSALVVGPSLADGGPVGLRWASARALEAVLGAVFRDGGFEACLGVVSTLLAERPPPAHPPKSPKSVLQETIQRRFDGEVPDYRIEERLEVEEAERFTAEVSHRGRVLGRGIGRSKKRAEEAAALDALGRVGGG